jgi:hypothetical protein
MESSKICKIAMRTHCKNKQPLEIRQNAMRKTCKTIKSSKIGQNAMRKPRKTHKTIENLGKRGAKHLQNQEIPENMENRDVDTLQ